MFFSLPSMAFGAWSPESRGGHLLLPQEGHQPHPHEDLPSHLQRGCCLLHQGCPKRQGRRIIKETCAAESLPKTLRLHTVLRLAGCTRSVPTGFLKPLGPFCHF